VNELVFSCPLCGGQKSSVFARPVFRDEALNYRLCANCGLVYQSPRKTPEELAAFYEREYRRLYQGSEEPTAKDLAVQQGRAQALGAFLQDRLPAVKRHLDIGCSAGLLLKHLNGLYGCQSVGIEPGQAYRAYAQKDGIPIYPTLEDLRASFAERFDLISLAHVLEHLPEPHAYLASLRETLLTQDGTLLVEVPNLYAHDSFETAHLVAYSSHTLSQMLATAGFAVLALREHGRPRSEILPLYITVLARPSKQRSALPIQPERNVRLKRRVGLLRRRLLTRLSPRRAWRRMV